MGGCCRLRDTRGFWDAVAVLRRGGGSQGLRSSRGSALGPLGFLRTKGDFMAEPFLGPLCPPGAAAATPAHLQLSTTTHP